MSTTTTNGRPRRQLSDQLDRLDGIIDLLATNLNEAVAEACRDGVRQAVQEALAEVFASPDLHARLAPPAPPARPIDRLDPVAGPADRASGPGPAGRRRRVSGGRSRGHRGRPRRLPRVAAEEAAARRRSRRGSGGLAGYLTPQAVAAVVAGAGGSGLTRAVQGGLWARAAARRYGLL